MEVVALLDGPLADEAAPRSLASQQGREHAAPHAPLAGHLSRMDACMVTNAVVGGMDTMCGQFCGCGVSNLNRVESTHLSQLVTLPRLLTLCMPLAGVARPVSADEMRETCDELDTTRSSCSGTRRRLTGSGGGGGDVLMVYPPAACKCKLRYETYLGPSCAQRPSKEVQVNHARRPPLGFRHAWPAPR